MSSPLNNLDGLIGSMELKDRIREAMTAARLNPAELARATKSTNAAVTFWLNGQTKSLKAEKAAFMETATGYRAQWIISGKGPKMVSAIQSGVTPPDYKPNPHLAHVSKAQAAIKSGDLSQAMQVLANALANADPVYRNGAKAYLEGLCDNPDRTDLIDLICHTLDPPASH